MVKIVHNYKPYNIAYITVVAIDTIKYQARYLLQQLWLSTFIQALMPFTFQQQILRFHLLNKRNNHFTNM